VETKTLNIEGMSCSACVRAVTNALLDLDGVKTADVSLDAKQAIVTYDPAQVQVGAMTAVIDEEGYAVTSAD
jgi:copper chaperone